MARSILSEAERLAWERFPQDPDPDVIGVYFTLADVGADTSLEGYGEGEARWEHQAEIRRAYGYRPFGDEGIEKDELVLWLHARAWIRPRATVCCSRGPLSI